jgi:hypothetical protein
MNMTNHCATEASALNTDDRSSRLSTPKVRSFGTGWREEVEWQIAVPPAWMFLPGASD